MYSFISSNERSKPCIRTIYMFCLYTTNCIHIHVAGLWRARTIKVWLYQLMQSSSGVCVISLLQQFSMQLASNIFLMRFDNHIHTHKTVEIPSARRRLKQDSSMWYRTNESIHSYYTNTSICKVWNSYYEIENPVAVIKCMRL